MTEPTTTQPQADDPPGPTLSWALTIATYNRQAVLPRAVRCAVRQDPPPSEVVIVDASDDWETTRGVIEALIKEEGAGTRLDFQQARARGITAQRNQAIEASTADILFLIDDDSLMHPGCARHVLDVFGHPDGAKVLGVCTALTPDVPDKASDTPPQAEQPRAAQPAEKGKVNKKSDTGMRGGFVSWMIGEYLPHYDTPEPAWDVPQSLREAFGCFGRRQVHGARMVFRRSAFGFERFDPTLNRYSYLEDTDLGYRLGKHGIIVTAPKAKICHLGDLGGRLPTLRASIISVTNAAFLTRKNAEHAGANLRRIRLHTLRRSFYVLLKDLAKGQWKIPQFRGQWIGLMHTRWIASTPLDQLDTRYQQFQEQLLSGR